MIDWLGSALAGKGARPVETIARFAERMGPADGPSEVLIHRRGTSPLLRRDGQRRGVARRRAGRPAQRLGVPSGGRRLPARARGRAGARRERRASCSPPSSPATRSASASASSSAARTTRVFHTTGTAGTLAAAAAVGQPARPRRRPQMPHAFGSAGTQAAGPVGVPARRRRLEAAAHRARGVGRPDRGLPRRRRLHRREADPRRRAGDGGGPVDATPIRRGWSTASARAGRWPRPRSSSTPRAGTRIPPPMRCCRRCRRNGLRADDIAAVTAQVHQGAIDVLGPVVDPQTVHQSKFSMGTVLGLIARPRPRRPDRVRRALARRPTSSRSRDRVAMELDAEVDAAYPARWIGKVTRARRRTAARSRRASTSRRAIPATRSAAPRSRTRRSASPRTATARAATRWRARSSASAPARDGARRLPARLTRAWRRAPTCSFPPTGPSATRRRCASGADAVIVDLEDAVAREREGRRARSARRLARRRRRSGRSSVRINDAASAVRSTPTSRSSRAPASPRVVAAEGRARRRPRARARRRARRGAAAADRDRARHRPRARDRRARPACSGSCSARSTSSSTSASRRRRRRAARLPLAARARVAAGRPRRAGRRRQHRDRRRRGARRRHAARAPARLRRQALHPSAPGRGGARGVRAERRRARVGRARRRRCRRRAPAARSRSTAGWSTARSCCAPRRCSRANPEPRDRRRRLVRGSPRLQGFFAISMVA